MSKRKERKHIVNIELPSVMNGGKIGFDNKTGEIYILDENYKRVFPAGLTLEHHYEGDKRKVLLSRLISGSKFPLRGLNDFDFLATYNLVYILDTNHLETSDKKTHDIACFLRASITCLADAYQVDLYERVGYFHFINLVKTIHAEKAAWSTLIQQEFFQKDLQSGLSIAIITDHDINSLDAYNRREPPILDGYYVPDGVTLMFATADKSDTFVNKLIKTTDRLANLYKERFSTGEIALLSKDDCEVECENFCFFNEKRNGLSIEPNIIKRPDMVVNESSRISYSFVGEDL